MSNKKSTKNSNDNEKTKRVKVVKEKDINKKNKDKKTATRSMITFLVLNTGGVTLIATDILAMRSLYGSANPTEIVPITILATLSSTIFGLCMDRIFYYRDRRKHGTH